MEYFKLLNLNKEPFSNAADPDFFFKSRQHLDCLQQLELSVRNRRGMNVVIGDVGTGKTTLCHQLIRLLRDESSIENHLILNPDFRSTKEFLVTVVQLFSGKKPADRHSERDLKKYIKRYLFHKVLKQKQTIVLIIDEGQKLPTPCLEVVRELLNFETSEYKVLQFIIFAQKEFELKLKEYVNFTDRINLYFTLNPLKFKETRKMIQFRLNQAKKTESGTEYFREPDLFSFLGKCAVYIASNGYPRKIVNLCHHSLIKIIVNNRPSAGWFTVRSCLKQSIAERSMRLLRFEVSMVTAVLLAMMLIIGPVYGQMQKWRPRIIEAATTLYSKRILHLATEDPQPDPPPAQIQSNVPKEEPLPEPPTTTLPKATAQAEIAVVTAEAQEESVQEKETPVSKEPEKPSSTDPPVDVSPPAFAQTAASPSIDNSIKLTAQMNNPMDKSSDSTVVHQNTGIENTSFRKSEAPVPTPPLILGQLVAYEDEIISWMVLKTYGSFKQELLDIVISANKHIDDPDHAEGKVISLPAIPFFVDHMKANYYWIQLDVRDSLREAFDVLRSYPKSYPNHAPNFRLIPYWNGEDGLMFSIIFIHCFIDEPSARHRMNAMTSPPSSHRKIISSWNKKNIYYADPYFCKNLKRKNLNKG